MSTSPAEDPVPGIVTFTDRGDAALDRLAAALVADCDGSTASIADILEQVLSADIDELADKLDEPMAGEVVPESPDEGRPPPSRLRQGHRRRHSTPTTLDRALTGRPARFKELKDH
jgi:hypothetical protein